MIKRSMLRLKVLDATKSPFYVCKIIRAWNPKTVTFKTAPAFDGPVSKCRKIVPVGVNNWVAVDISEWIREWVTTPKTNYGLVFFPPGSDTPGSYRSWTLMRMSDQVPSLSCHGDKVDYDHVFKEKKGSLRRVEKRKL